MPTIFVVSDATGETVERMVRSALVQFEDADVHLHRRMHVRTDEQVRAVVREATGGHSIIFHTLVSEQLRRLILAESRALGVDCMDMMGPLLERLGTHLRLAPQEKPGLLEQIEEAKTREITAVSFAFRHDDGQNPNELDRAEVVVVGVSRSMKTPTMLYLAYRGWFAANVPIIPEIPLPEGLLRLPPGRVFCLHMAPDRLNQLRRARAVDERIPIETYASLAQVRRELAHAAELCRKHRWRAVDVTGKSVEEVAREIIMLLSDAR